MSDIAAAIVAAGRGARIGGAPKQYRLLAGKPVLRWALEAFAAHPRIGRLIVAIAPGDEAAFAEAAAGLGLAPVLVHGGDTRTSSVAACIQALAAAPPECVLVHDAARPLVSAALIDRVIAALAGADAVAPALAPSDAVKAAEGEAALGDDVAREGLRMVQTPQGFRYAVLARALAAAPPGAAFPDEVALVRAAGVRAVSVSGDPDNLKITYKEDFSRAELRLLKPVRRAATGTGFDAHRLGPGDGVWLCGVKVPFERALIGHSDADVGLHAVVDALLGALGAGDIGEHFPPSDPKWKGAPSRVFAEHAASLARAAGAELAHVDVTVICEAPRLKPHRAAMREALAEALGLSAAQVSVKATTTEGMGFTGRSEGVAAQAVATLVWR